MISFEEQSSSSGNSYENVTILVNSSTGHHSAGSNGCPPYSVNCTDDLQWSSSGYGEYDESGGVDIETTGMILGIVFGVVALGLVVFLYNKCCGSKEPELTDIQKKAIELSQTQTTKV